MRTINLVQGDLTPIIVLKTVGVDLTQKTLSFEMTRVNSRSSIVLPALHQPSGEVHVPLDFGATDKPGLYKGQLVIEGEQTTFEQIQIYVRPRAGT